SLAREETRRPFDLAALPLWRVLFLRLAEEEGILLFTAHHIITDGWSHNLLMGELGKAYTALRAGNRPDPGPSAPSYPAYALNERAPEEASLSYWRDRLGGDPPRLELPTDRVRPPVLSLAGGFVPFRLEAPLTSGLKALGQEGGASL